MNDLNSPQYRRLHLLILTAAAALTVALVWYLYDGDLRRMSVELSGALVLAVGGLLYLAIFVLVKQRARRRGRRMQPDDQDCLDAQDPFIAEVLTCFRYLVEEYGFSVSRVENPGSHDDRLVQFDSTRARLRVVRDRGSILITMAPPRSLGSKPGNEAEWYGLSCVATYLEHPEGAWESRIDPGRFGDAIADVAANVYDLVPCILAIFCEDCLVRTLSALRQIQRQPFS